MKYVTTAISIKSTKEAALYFDNVIPFLISTELFLAGKEFKEPDINPDYLLENLIPKELAESDECGKLWSDLEATLVHYVTKDLIDELKEYPKLKNYIKPTDKYSLGLTLQNQFNEFKNKFNLSGYPVIIPSNSFTEKGEDENILLTLNHLNLIDVNKLSWEKLLEFRKDSEARNKLRKLRLFAIENYQGKEKSFIEDDLSTRIYDYQRLVKDWDFITTHSVVSMILTSKILGATISGSILGTFLGLTTSAALLSIGSVATVEIGKVILEVSRKKFELRQALEDNPISYINYINKNIK